jgi:hypothetical protein
MAPLERIIADVAFWIGLVSVLLFAYSRFNVSLPDTDELSPPLEPRSFTTAFRFQLAAFTYVGLYAGVYFVLLLAGSFPWLQELVKELFGSLETADKESVGTPAWAALVATSVLPSTPGFRWIDERWRLTLHDFASIPTKARMLGREILDALPHRAPKRPSDEASLATLLKALGRHKERFTAIQELAQALVQTDAGRASRRYRMFFADHQNLVDRLRDEFSVDAEHCNTVESARYVEERFHSALRRAARFLACAMLNAEPSEYAVRSRLRNAGLAVHVAGFDFRPGHMLLAITTIGAMTLVSGHLAVLAHAVQHQLSPVALLSQYSVTIFSWVLITVIAYGLPIILAAGVEMYVLDRYSSGEPLDAADYAAVAILTFVGAAGLSFFSLLTYSFVMLKIATAGTAGLGVQSIQLWHIVPWALPPAVLATAFLIMAGRTPNSGRARELTIDALVHGGLAAVVSLLAVFLSMLAGNDFASLPSGLILYLAPTTAGAIGASIGLVLCGTCRQQLHPRGVPAVQVIAPARPVAE